MSYLKDLKVEKNPEVKNDLILDGTQSIALGAIAGGVQYECFYPMAPSTGLGTFLTQQASKFGLIVDQSEDEISVINKALGASYAGARSLVTTSGGGFALMTEAYQSCGNVGIAYCCCSRATPGSCDWNAYQNNSRRLTISPSCRCRFLPQNYICTWMY